MDIIKESLYINLDYSVKADILQPFGGFDIRSDIEILKSYLNIKQNQQVLSPTGFHFFSVIASEACLRATHRQAKQSNETAAASGLAVTEEE